MSEFEELCERSIAFKRSFVRITGSIKAGLLLSQLAYWHGKSHRNLNRFYHSMEEIEEETGLSRKEQDSARKTLRDKKFLFENYERFPHRMWFQLNVPVIKEALIAARDERAREIKARNDRLKATEMEEERVQKENGYTPKHPVSVIENGVWPGMSIAGCPTVPNGQSATVPNGQSQLSKPSSGNTTEITYRDYKPESKDRLPHTPSAPVACSQPVSIQTELIRPTEQELTVHTKLPCAGGAIPPKQTSSASPPDPAAAPEPPEVEVDDVHAMPPPSSGLRPPLNLSGDLVSPQRTAKQNAPTRRSGGSDPRHAALVKAFSAEYASKFGVNYVFQGGKDGSALSSLLKAEPTLSVEQIMSVIKTGWTHNQSFIRSVSMSISRLPSIWNQLRVTAGPRVTEVEKERNYGW